MARGGGVGYASGSPPPPPLATQFLGERRITPAFGVETLLGSRAEADAEA